MVEERGELAGHPDQERWNARYARSTPSFQPHPLAEQVLGPAPAGPAPGDPVSAGPVPGDPVPAGPVPAGPVPGDPVPAGPVPAGPVPAGPVPAGPVPGDPVPAGPVPAGPVPAGPVPGDPVPAGPVPVGPGPLAGPELLGGLVPAGAVADLACGPSGSALLAAAHGRRVTAVDVSAVALGLLGQEARRRGLAGRITLVHADLASWRPDPAGYALVLCTGFWDPAVFAVAARATKPGGVLGWEAFTVAARQARPTLNPAWCLGPGEPAVLLPSGFTVLSQQDVPSPDHGDRRRLLARRLAQP